MPNPLEKHLIEYAKSYEDYPFGLPSLTLVQSIKGKNLTGLKRTALDTLSLLEEILESS
ncbi:MAG: hypothetical protein ACFFC7_13670 [Candidatus Hermodarchaeota archaeon]